MNIANKNVMKSLRRGDVMDRFNRNLELIDGLETNYLRILYYDFDKQYQGIYNSYENNRLCTIINGTKKVKFNDSSFFTYDENEFIVLPPYSSINLEIDIPTTALVIEIFNRLIEDITEKVSLEIETECVCITNNNFCHTKKTPALQIILEKILQTSAGNDKNKEFIIDLYAQEMTYNLLKNQYVQDVKRNQSNNFMQLAVKLMKNNLSGDNSIADIAQSLHMSSASFSTKFKQMTGVTPNKYLTNLKLLHARTQLQLKNKNVTEIALDLGYENISHFIQLFKEKFGQTPKQYILKQ